MNNKKIELFEDNELKIYSERDRKPEECKSPSDILVPVKDKLINTINHRNLTRRLFVGI